MSRGRGYLFKSRNIFFKTFEFYVNDLLSEEKNQNATKLQFVLHNTKP